MAEPSEELKGYVPGPKATHFVATILPHLAPDMKSGKFRVPFIEVLSSCARLRTHARP
jgi:hypothetical protein